MSLVAPTSPWLTEQKRPTAIIRWVMLFTAAFSIFCLANYRYYHDPVLYYFLEEGIKKSDIRSFRKSKPLDDYSPEEQRQLLSLAVVHNHYDTTKLLLESTIIQDIRPESFFEKALENKSPEASSALFSYIYKKLSYYRDDLNNDSHVMLQDFLVSLFNSYTKTSVSANSFTELLNSYCKHDECATYAMQTYIRHGSLEAVATLISEGFDINQPLTTITTEVDSKKYTLTEKKSSRLFSSLKRSFEFPEAENDKSFWNTPLLTAISRPIK